MSDITQLLMEIVQTFVIQHYQREPQLLPDTRVKVTWLNKTLISSLKDIDFAGTLFWLIFRWHQSNICCCSGPSGTLYNNLQWPIEKFYLNGATTTTAGSPSPPGALFIPRQVKWVKVNHRKWQVRRLAVILPHPRTRQDPLNINQQPDSGRWWETPWQCRRQ